MSIMKKFNRIASLVLSFSVIFSLNTFSVSAHEPLQENVDSAILSHLADNANEEHYTNSINAPIYDNFFVDDAFVCSVQTPDGVLEYAYNLNGIVYHKKFLNDNLIFSDTVSEAPTYTISNDEIQKIDALLEQYTLDSDLDKLNTQLSLLNCKALLYDDTIAVVSDTQNSTSSATSDMVYGGLNELINHSKWGKLSGHLSSSIRFYCTPLAQDKYVSVKDDRNNYVETDSKVGSFLAGASVVVAAASIYANPSDLLSWLGLSISVTSLPYSVSVHNTIEAKAYHYRYGQIYDSTRKAYVTCYSEYGYDYFVVSKQSSQYAWGVEPTPVDETYTDSYIATNAANAYNTAVERDGYWKW